MDTRRTRELGDTSNRGFNVLRRDHHQVGHFVDNTDDVREFLVRNTDTVINHGLGGLAYGGLLFRAEGEFLLLRQAGFLGEFGVKARDILHATLSEDLVAALHFSDEPLER